MTTYYGEHQCEAIIKKKNTQCPNKAYFKCGNRITCGQHKDEKAKELKKNPNAEKNKLEYYKQLEDKADYQSQLNRDQNKVGTIMCTKLKMMKNPEYKEGFYHIFPNYKHAQRKDGHGYPSLSPKSVGPIDHQQPGLPVCKNLENLHQGNKVFPDELGEDGNPLPAFYKTQREFYEDEEPHRHKPNAKGNIPTYSVWITRDGEEHHLSYFESRQIYCHYLVESYNNNPDFHELLCILREGGNLNIIGYDGYPFTYTPENLIGVAEKCYKDTSKPFGHEMVLCFYLLFSLYEIDEQYYPWEKYRTIDFNSNLWLN